MEYIKLVWLFSLCTIDIHASTHWMVTESGLIQPWIDSPFEMARPFDLLAFLNQDTRWDKIITLYHDLFNRQQVVDKLWSELERETDFASHLTLDENCVKAGQLNLLDWYTAFLEDGKSKHISLEEYLFNYINYGDTDVPDCKKISSLTFSMFAFEHLEGMIQRENLTANPEYALPEQISPIMTLDQLGHWLASVLRRNNSSWLHYNIASLYWRVRGNAPKALECSRRAVHYAPREYKDVALMSLGSILHRSKMSEDALVTLGAAVDHDPHNHASHFVLANAFAVLGDFNNSIKHLDRCLKLNPSFDLGIRHKNGVLCYSYLKQRVKLIEDSLGKLRGQLVQYSYIEADWLKAQAAFLKTMKHSEEFDYRNVKKNCEKMSELTGLNIKDIKKSGDKNSLIQYFLDGPMYDDKWLSQKGIPAMESAHSLQRLVQHIGKHSNMVSDFVSQTEKFKLSDGLIFKENAPKVSLMPDTLSDVYKDSPFDTSEVKTEFRKSPDKKSNPSQTEGDISKFVVGKVLYPSSMKISRIREDFDKESEWPSNRICKEAAADFPENVEAIYPTFLPFENKGIRLKTLLTDKIGVPAMVEHELPWHPPTCPHDKEAAAFTQKKSQKPQIISEVIATDYLKDKLLGYVGEDIADFLTHMQDAEIGQRIYAAMQMKLAPKWLLYTLSSLYWRVRGNNVNALHCLLTAGRTVDARYRDVVLASLASVYLEMGYADEALVAADEAYRISLYEPATNFILAELHMLKKQHKPQMSHLKQVIRVEPAFMGGVARNLLNGWACVLRQVHALRELEINDGDICAQVEPGMSMVCERDGTNCHVTNIQCYSSSRERESSALVRMLELKDDNIQSASVDEMDDSIFEQFLEAMPTDRSDRVAHQRNYDVMLKSISKALKSCGPKGCNIERDDLSPKREECTYQHLQLSYWVQIISFKQLLSDSELRLPSEITTMNPSSKKVPECRLPVDSSNDFFLERMSRVDTEDWEPVLSLMHQFVELFNFYDYVTLGAKIAKYVEARPMSWVGAVAAGWWCGAGGRGVCAVRCLSAAHALAHPRLAPHSLRALAALLHMQSKLKDAKDIAYLSFYTSPKNKIEAFLAAVSHTYMAEYEQSVWMYRYALTFDDKYLPARACLHATMCLMLYGDSSRKKHNGNQV